MQLFSLFSCILFCLLSTSSRPVRARISNGLINSAPRSKKCQKSSSSGNCPYFRPNYLKLRISLGKMASSENSFKRAISCALVEELGFKMESFSPKRLTECFFPSRLNNFLCTSQSKPRPTPPPPRDIGGDWF